MAGARHPTGLSCPRLLLSRSVLRNLESVLCPLSYDVHRRSATVDPSPKRQRGVFVQGGRRTRPGILPGSGLGSRIEGCGGEQPRTCLAGNVRGRVTPLENEHAHASVSHATRQIQDRQYTGGASTLILWVANGWVVIEPVSNRSHTMVSLPLGNEAWNRLGGSLALPAEPVIARSTAH